MYKIKEVEILGFWGKHTVKSKFFNDINIFIGANGTGKTTFISIIQSILEIDIERLFDLQFEKVILKLKKGKSNRKIEVSKILDNFEYKEIVFKIGQNTYKLPAVISNIDYHRSHRIHPRLREQIEELKNAMTKLINLSYLSVHRGAFDFDSERERYTKKMNLIDIRLQKLNQNFARYQWQLDTKANLLSRDFQKNVLKLMLFNEDFDYIDVSKNINFDSDTAKIGLTQAFKDLKVYDNETKKQIDKHIKNVSKAVSVIKEYQAKSFEALTVNDVTPLTLVKRSNEIVRLSNEMEFAKTAIYKPVKQYLELLNNFVTEKVFELTKTERGGLTVKKNDESFPIEHLSSGEKQLLILFTEALLQKKENYIFIADEPELSLHISWQRKIVSSVKALNPNAQIIIATHSPEVVGKYRKNITNMKDIIND